MIGLGSRSRKLEDTTRGRYESKLVWVVEEENWRILPVGGMKASWYG